MAAGLGSTWWQYLLLFLAVAASWAGVPAIGTAALGAAAVAASQGKLNLAAVLSWWPPSRVRLAGSAATPSAAAGAAGCWNVPAGITRAGRR